MLHITNGDSAAATLRQSGIPGDVLPWRDVLHEGPVPANLSLGELRRVRAGFIADVGWGALEEVVADFARRDRALEGSLAHDEVVLWFEHDLYDQLQLLQLLDWFAQRDPGAARLTLICAAEYLGSAPPERLRERFPSRQPAAAPALALARRAWAAFRSPDPTAITELLREDASPLPFVRGALLRHLQQFPSVANGLSRSEAQALEAVASGEATPRRAYVASHHRREEPVFLGDSVFALYLEGLSREGQPLVLREDGGVLAAPRGQADAAGFWDGAVRLTEAGRAVLEGRADRVRLNGMDRWLGGVRLSGAGTCWRWDEAAACLRRDAA